MLLADFAFVLTYVVVKMVRKAERGSGVRGGRNGYVI